jgi:hypothetical protein
MRLLLAVVMVLLTSSVLAQEHLRKHGHASYARLVKSGNGVER